MFFCMNSNSISVLTGPLPFNLLRGFYLLTNGFMTSMPGVFIISLKLSDCFCNFGSLSHCPNIDISRWLIGEVQCIIDKVFR